MRILMVAGGSGGHIYPCLELAKYFISKGEVVFLGGNNNSLEEKIYKDNGLNFIGIDINKKKITSHFKNLKLVKQIYKDNKIDLVILFGNYISVSFGLGAIALKIPVYVHEQNVIYGRANKLLGMKARKVYLSLPIKNDIFSKKSILVGNPKAESYYKRVNLDKSKCNVIITMGSLGSTTVNKIIKELLKNISDNGINYHIVVGKKYYDEFIKNVRKNQNIHIYPYLENLSSYIKECDVFVSRAGATTISEIIYNEVVSILIPSPYVKDNHQYLNAKYLEERDACVLKQEKEINGKILEETINSLANNKVKKENIKSNLRKMKVSDIKEKIYEDIKNDYKK